MELELELALTCLARCACNSIGCIWRSLANVAACTRNNEKTYTRVHSCAIESSVVFASLAILRLVLCKPLHLLPLPLHQRQRQRCDSTLRLLCAQTRSRPQNALALVSQAQISPVESAREWRQSIEIRRGPEADFGRPDRRFASESARARAANRTSVTPQTSRQWNGRRLRNVPKMPPAPVAQPLESTGEGVGGRSHCDTAHTHPIP